MSYFIQQMALGLFWLLGSIGGFALAGLLICKAVDIWARVVGIHEELLKFIWLSRAGKFRIPNPTGLGYTVQILREAAAVPCSRERSEPCRSVGHKNACAGCGALFALEQLGLRSPVTVFDGGPQAETRPCAECGHLPSEHISGTEGECMACGCHGWVQNARRPV